MVRKKETINTKNRIETLEGSLEEKEKDKKRNNIVIKTRKKWMKKL